MDRRPLLSRCLEGRRELAEEKKAMPKKYGEKSTKKRDSDRSPKKRDDDKKTRKK